MNIDLVNNNNISMHGKTPNNPNWFKRQIRRVGQKLLDITPFHTSNESKKSVENWNKTSHWIGDPMWNRGILGATALLTQPAIDYYNHRVDDETRVVSRNRTISKIVAGTLVGMFVVRGPVYKLVEKMTDLEKSGKWSKKLLPKKYIDALKNDKDLLMNYRSATAMTLALIVMSITNFALDAPLTTLFTNYLNKRSSIKYKTSASNESEVKNV